MAALPGLEELAAKSNQFSIDQITKMLSSAIPGYEGITKSASSNIAALLRGEIPEDVKGQIQTSDAVKALTGGYAGTGAAGNLTARDLGLTSLSLTEKGLSAAESWMGIAGSLYEPGMLNMNSMFISPQQLFTADMQNQTNKWNQQWLTNQIKAMPDPGKAAIARDVGGMADIAGTVIGKFLGDSGGNTAQGSPNNSSSGLNMGMVGSLVSAAGGGGGGL